MDVFAVLMTVAAVIELIWLYIALRTKEEYEFMVLDFIRVLKRRKKVESEEDQELFKVFYDAIGLCKKTGLDPYGDYGEGF